MSGGAMQHNATGFNDEYEYVPSSAVINAGAPIIGESVSAIDDPAWPYEDEDLEVRIEELTLFLLHTKYAMKENEDERSNANP